MYPIDISVIVYGTSAILAGGAILLALVGKKSWGTFLAGSMLALAINFL